MSAKNTDISQYIKPLNMNGMSGRMLHLPPKSAKSREILFIYGHHASIERHFGVAEFLSRYGTVTIPDLPGFGGMDSFYTIGKKPTLDNMADYLASFIKLRYKNKKLTLAGYSLGVAYITRMLQKYPEMLERIDFVISLAGFTKKNDFIFTKKRLFFYNIGVRFFAMRIPSLFFKHIILRPVFIRSVYSRSMNAKHKFAGKQADEFEHTLAMEVNLWRSNDVRTYMYSAKTMFTFDLTDSQVHTAIYHAHIDKDQYFNHAKVDENLNKVYSEVHTTLARAPTHSPSVVASAKEAAPFIPPAFRRILNKKT